MSKLKYNKFVSKLKGSGLSSKQRSDVWLLYKLGDIKDQDLVNFEKLASLVQKQVSVKKQSLVDLTSKDYVIDKVVLELNNFLKAVSIQANSDIDEFKFSDFEFGSDWVDIDEMEEYFVDADGLKYHDWWLKLQNKIIFNGEFLQIHIPINFRTSGYDGKRRHISVIDKIHKMFDKRRDVSIRELLEKVSMLTYDYKLNRSKGGIREIITSKNEHGVVFKILVDFY